LGLSTQNSSAGFDSMRKSNNILERLYNPFIRQKVYFKDLNNNVGKIKKLTKNDARINTLLKQKNKDINKISNETLIYNNPSKYVC
jgi:ribosomal protein L29